MHFLYNILVILVVIFAMPIFLVRSIQEKGIGERVRQSFGFLPKDVLAPVAGRGCIWLHAASVGEIVATSPIVKEIRKELPGIPILVSVVTTTGYTMAKHIIHEADSIIFFPLDLPWLSNLVVKRISPRAFLPVETELWPNFLQAARNSKIPVMMVNGRISDKSVRRYHYLRGVLKEMLATVVQFCMQSNVDAKYVIRLGADPQRVVVTGNTKFDQTYTDVSYAEREILCSQMGLKDCHPIMIAGSTHKGEEELVISAYKQIRDSIPSAKLLIAPRDTLRAEEVANLATSHGLAAARRTVLLNNPSSAYDIVVLDTIGELGKIYSIGDIIYVGGSLIPHGGHNILEPAAHGKPILVGPHMFNFKDTYALFSGREACVTVGNAAELAEKTLYILNNEAVRESMSREALAIMQENRGAARKSALYLKAILEKSKSKLS